MQYQSPLTESEKAAAARKAVVIDDYRRHLFDWMDKNDIAQLVVKFEGYGDSGQVEDVACYDADEKLIIGLPVPKTVRLPARQTADRWDEELRKVVPQRVRTRSLWTRRWKRSCTIFWSCTGAVGRSMKGRLVRWRSRPVTGRSLLRFR